MATGSISGHSIGYVCNPSTIDCSKPALVFVHGTGGDRDDWKNQLENLSDVAGLAAIELPGHGQSDGPGESNVAAFSHWVSGFVGELGLEQVMLVGCSLGSAITQWIALEGKPWLKAIGLVGAGCRLKVHPSFLEGIAQDKEKALNLLGDFALGPNPDDGLKRELSAKFRKCPPDVIHGDLTACNEFDVTDRVESIKLPTFIAVGREDRLTPVKYSEFLHEKIPNTQLNIIPDAGHLVMLEKPEEFNRLLRDFVIGPAFAS